MSADTESFKSADIDTETDISAKISADTDTETDNFRSLVMLQVELSWFMKTVQDLMVQIWFLSKILRIH